MDGDFPEPSIPLIPHTFCQHGCRRSTHAMASKHGPMDVEGDERQNGGQAQGGALVAGQVSALGVERD
jgi:hypothetical protein